MAEANTESRNSFFWGLGDDISQSRNCGFYRRRIAGTVGNEEAVDLFVRVEIFDFRCGNIVRHNFDIAASLGEIAEDVHFRAAVEGENLVAVCGFRNIGRLPVAERFFPGAAAGAANAGNQVLASHAGGGLREFDELGIGEVGAVGEDAIHRAAGAEDSGEGAGVDALEAQDVRLGKIVRKRGVGAVVGMEAGEFADNEAGDLDLGRFDVFNIGSGVADEGDGGDENLAGVGRVGQRFLVAAHRSVKHDFGGGGKALTDSAKCPTLKDHAIGQREAADWGVLGGVSGIGCWHGT